MVNFYKNFSDRIDVVNGKQIYLFPIGSNLDPKTIESFGDEWKKFNSFEVKDLKKIGDDYFDILPKEVGQSANVLDVGCGSGRWAAFLSSKVGFIECVDPSNAVYAAARFLNDYNNVRISKADVENLPFENESFDLVYSLGVLHHIPDTKKALAQCTAKVKKGGYLLVYLYYHPNIRGFLFRMLFYASDLIRKVVSRLPGPLKRVVCDFLAIIFYMPFVILCRILKKIGVNTTLRSKIPLSYYEDKSFHVIRNDCLDRFGTPLEKRFSKEQIEQMLVEVGLSEINFSKRPPYWHVIAKKY